MPPKSRIHSSMNNSVLEHHSPHYTVPTMFKANKKELIAGSDRICRRVKSWSLICFNNKSSATGRMINRMYTDCNDETEK